VVGFPSVFRTVRAARFLAERAEIVGAFAGGTLGCREIGP
jgi:hypothetical protein